MVGIGFGVFAAIFAFTFLLLLVVTLVVFVALGISFANEPGHSQEPNIGIMGGVGTVIFYGLLGTIFVVPTALASRKLLKRRPNARIWGIVAAIVLAPIIPLGTMLGVYALWFFFNAEGRRFFLSVDSNAIQNLPNQ